MYHYVRTLIHRPLVLANDGNQASSSLVTLSQSSKHVIQIIQLLEERRMGFSFSLNKNHLLTMAGFGLLYQVLNLSRESKIVQEAQRYLRVAVIILDRDQASGCSELKKIISVTMMTPLTVSPPSTSLHCRASPQDVSHSMPAPKSTPKARRKLQNAHRMPARTTSALSPPIKKEQAEEGRLVYSYPARSQYPTPSYLQDTGNKRTFSPDSFQTTQRPHSFPIASGCQSFDPMNFPNLDYLDFSNEPATFESNTERGGAQTGLENTFASPSAMSYASDISATSTKPFDWSADLWTTSGDTGWQSNQGTLSLSEEDLTSGEELSSCGASGHFPSFPSDGDLTALGGFGGNFGM